VITKTCSTRMEFPLSSIEPPLVDKLSFSKDEYSLRDMSGFTDGRWEQMMDDNRFDEIRCLL
jgi:hypothetical protein